MKKHLFMILIASLGISMIGCSKDRKVNSNVESSISPSVTSEEQNNSTQEDSKRSKIILTVNDISVTYAEVLIYLQSNKEEIESIYGTDVWTMAIDGEGTTYEEMMKQSVLEEIIYLKLVCSQAEALGISLTEDELLDVDEYTAKFLSNFSEEALEYYNVDKGLIRNIYMDNVLANKVFESLTLNVDTNVTNEEAKQAVFQYILIGKYGYNADGDRYEYTQEQLEEAKTRAYELREEGLTQKNFSDFALANSDDEDEVEITVGTGDMKPELEKVAFSLKEGEISEVIDTEDGYFIFKCIEEMNQDATDEKKEEIIKTRQEVAFDEKYKIWDDAKKVELDEELWNSISITGKLVQ